MRSRLDAVVFDLDGTLVDSVPDITSALNAALVEEGRGPLDLAAVASMVGGGADLLVERALKAQGPAPSRTAIDGVLGRFLELYRAEPCARTRLYPGARELIDELSDGGLRLGICTNKPEDLTRLVLDGLGIADRFASVVAASPALPPKPAPDMLLAALAGAGARPERAVMVGDSATDAATARAAGVSCVLLRHGYSSVPVDSLGAEAVADDIGELRSILCASAEI